MEKRDQITKKSRIKNKNKGTFFQISTDRWVQYEYKQQQVSSTIMIKEKTVSRTGMVFNKSFGQHILINAHILKEMVDKSAIRPTDVVLEIGPGTGNLTALLLERAKKVIAVEVDPRMVSQLTKRFKYSEYQHKFTLIPGDVMGVEFPFFDICVANIPYQISSPLVFKLLSHQPTFRCAVLMFQKEFAQRLIAKPGSDLYCRLSVNVQLLSRVDHLIKVGKNNFKPPPKVQSSIVRIQPKNPRPNIDYLQWDGLLRICFIRKNKTLQAAFKNKKILQLLYENREKFVESEKNQRDLIQQLGKIEIEQDNNNNNSNKKSKKNNGGNMEEDQESDSENDMIDQKVENERELSEAERLKKQKKQKYMKLKDQIMEILTRTQYATKRTTKLSLDDFMILLAEFNSNGIHFR